MNTECQFYVRLFLRAIFIRDTEPSLLTTTDTQMQFPFQVPAMCNTLMCLFYVPTNTSPFQIILVLLLRYYWSVHYDEETLIIWDTLILTFQLYVYCESHYICTYLDSPIRRIWGVHLILSSCLNRHDDVTLEPSLLLSDI